MTITTTPLPSGYVAHLDPMSGLGLLLCPVQRAENDIALEQDGREDASLQHADYLAACRALERDGWTTRQDNDPEVPMALWGGVLAGKHQDDGREAVMLARPDAIASDADELRTIGEALAELGESSGVAIL